LVVGFWLQQVADMAEAVEWVKRCFNPMPGPSEIEVRLLFEAADFGDAVTPVQPDSALRTAPWARFASDILVISRTNRRSGESRANPSHFDSPAYEGKL